MRRGILAGGFLAAFLSMSPLWAEPLDSTTWLKGDYIGVGAIDVPRLAHRRIYTYLMDFFVTDKNVRQAFGIIRDAGIRFEDVLTRIVVGIPSDIQNAEHVILWETNEELSKYRTILAAYGDRIDKRMYQGMEYYATKRENECLAILDNVLVLGSELKVLSVIDSYRTQYRGGVSSAVLRQEILRVDKSRDAWFAFAVDEATRERIKGKGLVFDWTSTKEGILRLWEVPSGNMTLDFSTGLRAHLTFVMDPATSVPEATTFGNAALTSFGKNIPELQAVAKGFRFVAAEREVLGEIDYSQETFDQLIDFTTLLVKEVGKTPATKPSDTQKSSPGTQGTQPPASPKPAAPSIP
ncbi:MAG: hypothetical protein ACI4VB_11360 [Bradymonadia bacterium]